MSISKSILVVLLLFVLGGVTMECVAQDKSRREIIQLSGIVVSSDSVLAIPGAHIYVPKSGRGTVSNRMGYFSFPTMEGDSVVISSIGYERQHYIIPDTLDKQFITVIVRMPPSITQLEEVRITLFPTESAFKGAVLALNIPTDQSMLMNLPAIQELMARMRAAPMDSYANYQYYTNQYLGAVDDRFRPRVNPLLDLFNWYRFFRSLKKKKDKK